MARAEQVDPLSSWLDLNAALKRADEKTCIDLLRRERGGKARRQFLKRIHNRFNKMRGQRERRELLGE